MGATLIEELAQKSDDDLYFMLGESMFGSDAEFGPGSAFGRSAREWFERKHQLLQGFICDNPVVQNHMAISRSDAVVDTLSVVQAIRVALDSSGMSVLEITITGILVARSGLHLFCSDRVGLGE